MAISEPNQTFVGWKLRKFIVIFGHQSRKAPTVCIKIVTKPTQWARLVPTCQRAFQFKFAWQRAVIVRLQRNDQTQRLEAPPHDLENRVFARSQPIPERFRKQPLNHAFHSLILTETT